MIYMNLFPDMSREQYADNDTFIYAAPISVNHWLALQNKARRTPERVGYLTSDDIEGLEDSVIILRSSVMTDDDCLSANAYLRVVENLRGRAYCVPGDDDPRMIQRAAGAPRSLCAMISIKEDATEE